MAEAKKMRQEIANRELLDDPEISTLVKPPKDPGRCPDVSYRAPMAKSRGASVGLLGPLPVEFACHFARQVALGLQHAHERGMVHRDIKPQNLMLSLKN